jgi:hypothetical protein
MVYETGFSEEINQDTDAPQIRLKSLTIEFKERGLSLCLSISPLDQFSIRRM